MLFRGILLGAAWVVYAVPAIAQTYTFSCQADRFAIDRKDTLISLGDQFLGVGRRVFSFDEKAGKACEVNMQARACSEGPLWTGVADAAFTRISLSREHKGSAGIDLVSIHPGQGLYLARILEPDKGMVEYSGACKPLTALPIKLPPN